MNEQKLTALSEFKVEHISESELKKQVSHALFAIWDGERQGKTDCEQFLAARPLAVELVLLERQGELKSHGLMSFLSSMGLPEQLWQSGYCLWARTDHAIRSYINTKDKLLTQLATLGKSHMVPGTVVDTLMNLKRYYDELERLGIWDNEVSFIGIMRDLHQYCSAEILEQLIEQQLELERYGHLRAQLLASWRRADEPLTAEQLELVDELVMSQKALSQTGLVVNQSHDIGDLVAHLDQNSRLVSSLKDHLFQNYQIEEIELDKNDLVEEAPLPLKPFSFLTSRAFRLPSSPVLNSESRLLGTLRLAGCVAACALLTFGAFWFSSSPTRELLSQIEEAPATAEFDEVEDYQIELMAFGEDENF